MTVLSARSSHASSRATRFLLILVLGLLLTLLSLPVLAAPEGWPMGWSDPVVLGQTSRAEGPAALANDEEGGLYVVFAVQRARPEADLLIVQYLVDGVVIAKKQLELDGFEGPYLPTAAAGGNDLDIVFQARSDSTYSLQHVHLTRSQDGLETESQGGTPVRTLLESGQFVGQPALARDASDQLDLAWSQRGDSWQAYASRLTPDGLSPRRAQVSDSPDPSIHPAAAVTPSGKLVVAWKERAATELTELHWASVEWPAAEQEPRVERHGKYGTNNGGSDADAPGIALIGEDPVFAFATREFDPTLRRPESGMYLAHFSGEQGTYYRVGDVGPTPFLPQLAVDVSSGHIHMAWASDESGDLAVFQAMVPNDPSPSGEPSGIYRAVDLSLDPEPISYHIPGSYLPSITFIQHVHVVYLAFARGAFYDVMYVNTATPARITLWNRLGLNEEALFPSAAWRVVDITLRALWLELVDAAILVLVFMAAMVAERTGLAERMGALGRLVALASLLFVLNSPVNPVVFGRLDVSWSLDLVAGLLATVGVWLFTRRGRTLYPQAITLTGAGVLWDFWYLLMVLLGTPGAGH